MKTVTLSTLLLDTGETQRALQHWTDSGVLHARRSTDRKGRGNRREYRSAPLHGERTYALLASALSRLRVPIEDIKQLIYGMRLDHDPVELIDKNDPHLEQVLRNRAGRAENQKKYPGFVHPFEAALAGEQNVTMGIALRPDDPVCPVQMIFLRDTMPFGPELARDHVNQKSDQMNMKLLHNLMAENKSAFVLNLSEIFKPLYSIPAPDEVDDEGDQDGGQS